MKKYQLLGPFVQILPMTNLPVKGALRDDQLSVLGNAGILIHNGKIIEIADYTELIEHSKHLRPEISALSEPHIAMPGFIDAHTHICFSGSRAKDYAMRNAGMSYLDIAKSGGGIWDTVSKTRLASKQELESGVIDRAKLLLKRGITTIEIKSGYGLSVEEELKMLKAIKSANESVAADLIPTCLAAHIFPKDHRGTISQYLEEIIEGVFPIMKTNDLSNRVDAFIEEEAYSADVIAPYLRAAQSYNFDITIHADQFHAGGSAVAAEYKAISADHLEASGDKEIELMVQNNVIATALPGASLGLGAPFTPARKILDAGGCLAIASDWNPGSAPMGDLLTCAAILGTFEKLSTAEILSGITFRAARALNLTDRGTLDTNKIADILAFPTKDYREVLYHQGQLQPSIVWKNGDQC